MALHAVCGVCERDVLVLQDFLDLLCFTAGFGHTRPRRLRPRWGVDARRRRARGAAPGSDGEPRR